MPPSITKRFTASLLTGISLGSVLLGSIGASTLMSLAPAHATTLKGGVVVIDDQADNPTINPDDVKQVEAGTDLEMTVSTELTPSLTVEGDEFFAKITKDYAVDGKIVIPKGTIVHGMVGDSVAPKRMGRNSFMNLKFDYLVTPDGREIPIDGGYSNRDSGLKAAAKIAARSTGYTLAGGIVGAALVLRYGGIAAVAASNGYALAGGAALGGAVGLTSAMLTKGKYKMIQPGAELKIKLEEGLSLPSMNMPEKNDTLALPGLDVKLLGVKFDKDPFGEATELTVTVDITNQTENTFTTFDIALQDENGETHYASPFGDTGLWFRKIEPNTHVRSNVSFSVDNLHLQHYLVFFKRYTREPLAKIAINAPTGKEKRKLSAR